MHSIAVFRHRVPFQNTQDQQANLDYMHLFYYPALTVHCTVGQVPVHIRQAQAREHSYYYVATCRLHVDVRICTGSRPLSARWSRAAFPPLALPGLNFFFRRWLPAH